MNNQQTLSIDLTKEEDAFRFSPNYFFSKLYDTGFPGKGLIPSRLKTTKFWA